MKILITGVVGFIGFHLARRLIENNIDIVGIDNLNSYYDIHLKQSRLEKLKESSLNFKKIDIANKTEVDKFFKNEKPDYVIHLAAQAGVRYSISNPDDYINSNVIGFQNIIENCRNFNVKHFLYASSSSVYGLNDKTPFLESHKTDNPASLYGATKKSNELVAFSYSHLFALPTTGLRFFTVYGPWGRPDMAYFSFTKKIHEGSSINIFGNGNMYRDFTYIDDIIDGILNLFKVIPSRIEPSKTVSHVQATPAEVYNIGNNKPEKLEYFISVIEKSLNTKAIKNYLPMQPGDVFKTHADINKIKNVIDFNPSTDLNIGIPKFIDWYKSFYV